MAELVSFILAARDRILMLFILTIAVIVVTYLIFAISGKTSIIKYLPGVLLVIAGFYYLYQGMQQLTTQSGLNELVSAVIFIVIGLIGTCYAMILGIYHQGEGQKSKRRMQALDYLQEARSAEPVAYPRRESVPVSESLPSQQQMEREVLKREAPIKEDKLKVSPPVQESEPDEKAIAKEEARKHKEAHKQELLQENEALYAERLSALYAEIQKGRDDAALARLEKQLEKKNAQRQALITYNNKAEAINEKETSSFQDEVSLFFDRQRLKVSKGSSDLAYRISSAYSNAYWSVSGAFRKLGLDISRWIGNIRSSLQAGKKDTPKQD